VGWKFWGKAPEDELEGVSMEFVIKFYDAAVRRLDAVLGHAPAAWQHTHC
jgi:hypothetical protein